MLVPDEDESLLLEDGLEEELPNGEIPEQLEQLIDEGLDDGQYTVMDDEVYEVIQNTKGELFLKKLGQFLDEQAEEQLIAMKNISVQVFNVAKGAVQHWGSFSLDHDNYMALQKMKFGKTMKKLRNGLKKTFGGIVGFPGRVATGAKDSVRSTGRRIGQSARDLGDKVKEEGIPGMAAGAVRKVGDGLEGAVSTVAEGKLASPDDLYVPGFEGMLIGDYLPPGVPVYEKEAQEVYNFLLALREDYEVFPEDLGLGRRNGQTREKILEDFLHYGTSHVRMLLLNLGMRRADWANDPDRTLTKNQVDILKGPIGERITEMHSTYIRGREEE